MRHWLKTTPLLLILLLVVAAPAAAEPTVNEFEIPTANAQPEDIVLGPDGNLWFTERSANKIGRVTPGNPPLIEDFPLPIGFTSPFNITGGPDGKIWATASNGAGAVLKIDPADPAAMEGHGGFGAGTAAGVATGSDGKIWFGDFTNHTVVRVNPADGTKEAASDFDLGTDFTGIKNLVGGPDGNVWVTEFSGRIARVTPTGTVTPFDIPGDGAWDIVVGPDNN